MIPTSTGAQRPDPGSEERAVELTPFAADALAKAGSLAQELERVATSPQYGAPVEPLPAPAAAPTPAAAAPAAPDPDTEGPDAIDGGQVIAAPEVDGPGFAASAGSAATRELGDGRLVPVLLFTAIVVSLVAVAATRKRRARG